jgi:hypothetical protein
MVNALRAVRRQVTPRGLPLAALLSRLAVLGLSAFHGWLLWTQIVGGRFAEPAVAFRWTVGALILAGFIFLRRLGVPLLWGRRAVVLWLFVFFLHWHAVASPSEFRFDPAALPESAAAFVMHVGLGPAAIALALALLAGETKRAAAGLHALRCAAVRAAAGGVPAAGFFPCWFSRPPPA